MLQILCYTLLLCMVYGAPTIKKEPELPLTQEEDITRQTESLNTGLYYDAYLQNVVKLLEQDESFRKKMENADFDDIRNGKLSNEINFMSVEMRDKLTDLKKEEINRLRKVLHAQANLDKGKKVKKTAYLNQIAEHLDHENPHSFEAADLTNLIRAATKDLENYDNERHEEFKKHEMQKELRREEKMQMLNEQDKERARQEYREKQKQKAENMEMHHPGSKAQLEEVWNEEDGLKEQEFNPKTFFSLHDLNGDGYLDEMELEALFEKDLEKAYQEVGDGFDQFEMDEERRKMREHVVKEVDKDGDNIVSLKEFLDYTKTNEFSNPDPDSYMTIQEQLYEHSIYTQDELVRYRSDIATQEQEIKDKLEILKAEAKNLGGMRREYSEDKRESSKDGIQEDETIRFQQREEDIKAQEAKLKELHKELQEQSKVILDLKQEVVKHESSEKVVEAIQNKVDKLPEEGKERQEGLQQAQKELESLRHVQGLSEDKMEQPPPPEMDQVQEQTGPKV